MHRDSQILELVQAIGEPEDMSQRRTGAWLLLEDLGRRPVDGGNEDVILRREVPVHGVLRYAERAGDPDDRQPRVSALLQLRTRRGDDLINLLVAVHHRSSSGHGRRAYAS